MSSSPSMKALPLKKQSSATSLASPPPTPSTSTLTKYNFARASKRDTFVYGSERPGYIHPSRDRAVTPRGPNVEVSVVTEWMNAMWEKGIRRILCLLTKDEMKFYQHPLLQNLRQRFEAVDAIDISVSKTICPLPKIMEALSTAEDAKEPICVHCSTGQGRTAFVLALWLHRRYNLSVDEAVVEVMKNAQEEGAVRKPTVEGVLRLLLGPSEASLPTMSSLTIGTPRPASKLHITFAQMGGTIDKDYPKMTSGFAFEIGEPASRRVLRNIPSRFTYDHVSVCRKDSQTITDADRKALIDMLSKLASTKVIVTHGTDTLLETAQFVGKSGVAKSKTIVFTGSYKPEKMVDSDASFNLGVAVGAMNLLGAGSFICMNGSVIESVQCRRDGRTGLFEQI